VTVTNFTSNNVLLANGTTTSINGTPSGTLTYNGTVLNTSAITTTSTTSNQVGGVTLNNGAVSGITTLGCGAITSSGALGLGANGITSGTINPTTNNTYNLGTATTGLWANVYATTFTGNVTGNVSGTAGGLTGTPNITVGTIGCGAITSSGALGLSTNGITSGTINPTTNNTYNLGTATTGLWANVYATTFTGALTGNVTGNCSGSSASCTGNAATATTASSCSGNAANATLLNLGKAFTYGNWYTTNETVGCNRFYFGSNDMTYVGGTTVRIRTGAVSGSNIAVFASNGVFIGTTETLPSYMLDVNGTINSSNIITGTSAFSGSTIHSITFSNKSISCPATISALQGFYSINGSTFCSNGVATYVWNLSGSPYASTAYIVEMVYHSPPGYASIGGAYFISNTTFIQTLYSYTGTPYIGFINGLGIAYGNNTGANLTVSWSAIIRCIA